MARLPDYTVLGQGPSARSGAGIVRTDLSAPARALSQAGQVVAGVGDVLNERAQKEQAFDTQRRFLEFASAQEQALTDQSQQANPGAFGFREGYTSAYSKAAKDFFKSVPDHLKNEYDQKLFAVEDRLSGQALKFEREARSTYYNNVMTDGLTTIENNLYANPDRFEENLWEGNSFIDNIPDEDLSPIAKEELRRQWKEKAQLASLSGMSPQARKEALGDAPSDDTVGKIISIESGGDSTAKNPRSSATGAGQFISGTWLRMMRAHAPELVQGKSEAEILALRNDPEISRRMVSAYASENENHLRGAGLPVNDGTIYLAHFAGAGGATKLLRAVQTGNGNASAEEILGADAVRANPFLKGKTAKDVADWAAGKMGSAKVFKEIDPRFADMSYTTREKVIALADQDIRQEQAAANAEAKAAYTLHKDAMTLGIETGTVLTQREILSDTMLDDGDKATLLKALRAKQGDTMATEEAIRLFRDGGLTVDPYSTDGKKTVDNVWGAVSQIVGPEASQPTLEELVRQTGAVPQTVVNDMRRGLSSTNVADVLSAAQMAQRLSTVDSAALARRDGGADVQRTADDFSFYVNRLNMEPEEAARRLMEANSPDAKRDRKVLEPAAKEFRKELEGADLGSLFDESILPFNDPQIGFDDGQRLGIMADYLDIAENEFYRTNGNADLAMNRAQEQMKRLYGVTELSGSKTVMKHPPERYWPAMPGSDPYGYVREQIADELVQFVDDDTLGSWFPNKAARDAALPGMRKQAIVDSLVIVATPETDAMVKAGQMPAYFVGYRDPNGNLQTIPGKLFVPDISSVQKESDRRVEQEVEWAREEDEELRLMQDDPEGARDRSLDTFIDGPVLP